MVTRDAQIRVPLLNRVERALARFGVEDGFLGVQRAPARVLSRFLAFAL